MDSSTQPFNEANLYPVIAPDPQTSAASDSSLGQALSALLSKESLSELWQISRDNARLAFRKSARTSQDTIRKYPYASFFGAMAVGFFSVHIYRRLRK